MKTVVREGVLSATIREALNLRAKMKADGMSQADLAKNFEGVIRSCWPFTREWKFLCVECSDLGLILHECDGNRQCGRHQEHLPHRYGTPCWCSLGARFKAKERKVEDFTQAGKTSSKPMTRFGR
jgi:hypothetical protein